MTWPNAYVLVVCFNRTLAFVEDAFLLRPSVKLRLRGERWYRKRREASTPLRQQKGSGKGGGGRKGAIVSTVPGDCVFFVIYAVLSGGRCGWTALLRQPERGHDWSTAERKEEGGGGATTGKLSVGPTGNGN